MAQIIMQEITHDEKKIKLIDFFISFAEIKIYL